MKELTFTKSARKALLVGTCALALIGSVGYFNLAEPLTVEAAEASYTINGITYNIAEATNSGQQNGFDCYGFTDGTCIVTGVQTSNMSASEKFWDDYSKVYFKDATANAMSLASAFAGADNIEEIDLSGLDTSGVANMQSMFYGCNKLASINLEGLDTSSVTNMQNMFYSVATAANKAKLSIDLDLSKTAYMNYMFKGSGFTEIKGNFTNVPSTKINTVSMFEKCENLQEFSINADSKIKSVFVKNMFAECSSLTAANLLWLDTSNATDMSCMFSGCTSITALDLSCLDTSAATNIYQMFYNCSSLKKIDLSSFVTNKVTNFKQMFYNCSSLKKLDLSSFAIKAASPNFTDMLNGCGALEYIDLSSFSIPKTSTITHMMTNCKSIKCIKSPNSVLSSAISLPKTLYPYTESKTQASTKGYAYIIGKNTVSTAVYQAVSAADIDDAINDDSIEFDNGYKSDEAENVRYIDSDMVVYDFADGTSIVTGQIVSIPETGIVGSNTTAISFQNIEVSTTNLNNLFNDCTNVTTIDMSSLDLSGVTNMTTLFDDCTSLETIVVPETVSIAAKDATLPTTMEADDADGNRIGTCDDVPTSLIAQDSTEYVGVVSLASIDESEATHIAATAVKENEVAATCNKEGSYDEVVYCSVCGEEISRETKTVKKLNHIAATAVKENEVAATCNKEGSYDEVVYCSVCGEEISRETKTVPATDSGVSSNTDMMIEASIAPTFKVTIPKKIVLSKKTTLIKSEEGIYTSPYTVSVEGDILGSQTISVTPDSTVEIKDSLGKDSVTAKIVQTKKTFSTEECALGTNTLGEILTVAKLSAGKWTGTFDFNINITE